MEELTIQHCDLNTDGHCDAADFAIFREALGTSRGQVKYNPLADGDADGTVTSVDQDLLFPNSVSQ
jgi:hypothetical protein